MPESKTTDLDLPELAESWLIALRAEHKSPNTVKAYGAALRAYLAAGFTVLDKRSVREHIASVPGESTANLRCRALKRFSAWLAGEGETNSDLLAGLKAPPPRDAEVPKVSQDEITALLKACGTGFRGRRDAALIQFGLETGCRAGEVLSLRLDDIDMKQ